VLRALARNAVLEIADDALGQSVVLRRVRHVEERDHLILSQPRPHLGAAVRAAVVNRHHQRLPAAITPSVRQLGRHEPL
jgi:hypothetical protein